MKEWIVPDEDIGVDGAYFGYVELIRCKDCKRWNTILDSSKAEYGLCQARSQLETTSRDHYCGSAERGEE